MVDVTGFEPATPCLQSKLRNAMWLFRLAFTYVLYDGFRRYSAVIVPKLFPHSAGADFLSIAKGLRHGQGAISLLSG
jgi:hypothetical protein